MSTDSKKSPKDEKWMQGAVKHPDAFKSYCKSKGLVDDEGNVTDECISEGKKSDDQTVRKRATLAETFEKNRKGDTLTFDDLEEYQEKLEEDAGLYVKDDSHLLFQTDTGEQFEIDFDINKFMKKKEKENKEQVYKRTLSVPPANKINDESKMTIENKSQETITIDAKEEPKKEEPKAKKTEVCEKELDMLREKAKKFDSLDKVSKDFTAIEEKVKNLTSLEEKIEKDLKEKETKISVEKEQIRKDKAKKIAQDFQLPEKLIESESQDFLDKIDNILNVAIKKPESTTKIQVDFETPQSDFQKQKDALREKYKIKVVK